MGWKMNENFLIALCFAGLTMLCMFIGFRIGVDSECPDCDEVETEIEAPEKLCTDVADQLCPPWGGSYTRQDQQACMTEQYSKCMQDHRDERACKADCMDIVSRLTDQVEDYYERWIACAEGEPE